MKLLIGKTMKLKFTVFALLSGMIINSCIDIKDDYTAPNWDTDLNIPLTNRFYSIDELTDNSKYVSIDSINGDHLLILRTDTLQERYGLEKFTDNRLNISINSVELPLEAAKIDYPVKYPDNVEVDSAEFHRGSLNLTVRNLSNTAVNGVFTFPNCLKNGEVVSMPVSMPASVNYNKTFNLEGVKYTSSGFTDKSKLMIIYSGNVVAGGKVNFDFSITNTKFNYIAGMIPSKELDPIDETMKVEIDDKVSEFRNKLKLYNSELVLKAKYLSDIPNLFDMQLINASLIGKNTNVASMYLKKNSSSNLGSFLVENGNFATKFDNANSNISEFISYLPEEMQLKSDLVMNPFNKRGAARMMDSFDVKAVINAWGLISADNVKYYDTLELNIDSDARSSIKDGRKATITIETENEVPLGTKLIAHFCDKNHEAYFSKNADITAATPNEGGYSLTSAKDKIVIELTENEIFQLSNSYYIIFELQLSSYNSGAVALRSTDKLKIKAYMSIQYNIDSEGIE